MVDYCVIRHPVACRRLTMIVQGLEMTGKKEPSRRDRPLSLLPALFGPREKQNTVADLFLIVDRLFCPGSNTVQHFLG